MIHDRLDCIENPIERNRDLADLVRCQGLNLGYVIAKRPLLSDFALSPTRIFKIDEARERFSQSCGGLASRHQSFIK